MKKQLLLLFTFLALLPFGMYASNIVRSYPDGWQNENVGWLYAGLVLQGANEETVIIPPYYHAYKSGTRLMGSAVVCSIQGYVPANDPEWMVKSPRRSVPIDDVIFPLDGSRTAAFKGCTNMRKLVLPPTINYIGTYAFEDCSLNELVCMAVVPPELGGDAFGKATISKVIVPKGTLATYKATEGWNSLNIEEGAEAYSDRQMVKKNGAWYEVVDEEAALVNSDDLTDPMLPQTLDCLINGKWKTVPVTSIRPWSVNHDIVLHSEITDIPHNWRDAYSNAVLIVTDDHPTLRSLTSNVITTKDGETACYIFNDPVVPHGVTTIADNALTYCSKVYLPITLTFIGQQYSAPTLYFTSEQPPSTTMSEYSGKVYAPKEYLSNYRAGVFSPAWSSGFPVGYEYIEQRSSDGVVSAEGYWNVKKGTCVMTSFSIKESDYDDKGVLNLPSYIFLNKDMQGPIEEYRIFKFSNTSGSWGGIDKVRVPEGIKNISKLGETSINEIYLPSTLQKCCTLSPNGLNVIKIAPENPVYDSRDNCNAIIETATNTLVSGSRGTTIPVTVEHIADSAFWCAGNLPEVFTIPSNVKTIGKCAFQNAYGIDGNIQIEFAPSSVQRCIGDSAFWRAQINKVVLNNVERIGNYAFEGCHNLNNITFDNSLKEIGDYAFRYCDFTSLSFPDALERIGNSAFEGMQTLETINFGTSLKEIGSSAFCGCGLTSLILPNSIESIGDYAFDRCDKLQDFTFDLDLNSMTYIGEYALNFYLAPEELHLPHTLTIARNSFNLSNLKTLYTDAPSIDGYGAELVNLEKVVIGNHKKNTEVFGDGFYGCPNLKEIILGDSVESISACAFSSVPITTISIPKSVKFIGASAFKNSNLTEVNISDISAWCSIEFEDWMSNPFEVTHKLLLNGKEVTDLEIPNGITSINAYAFCCCDGLTSVKIPKSVKTISEYAFGGCGGLTSVTIPHSVTTISKEAFMSCFNLEKLEIGDGITYIGEHAFAYNNNLKEVYCYAKSIPKMDDLLFDGTPIKNVTLYVPAGCKAIYQAHKIWRDAKIIREMPEVTITPITKAEEVFFGDNLNEDINLSNTVVNNTYYNMDADNGDGYDVMKNALILNSTMTAEQINTILNSEVGNADIRDIYNGIIFELPAGQGRISVDAKTIGSHVLNVQIGRGEPTKITKTERGTVDIPYNVAEPTYVYLYASTSGGSAARLDRAPSTAANSVLLYGYKVLLYVTITAKNYTIKYGDELPTFDYTSDGAALEGTPEIICEATKTSPVGTYPIVISKGSVLNYNVTYVNGTLTIEKAPLKITPKDYTIKQGQPLPTFEATYEGFKNDETEAVLTKQPTITTTATSASEPGEYEITISGAEAQNYEISYVNGKLTITEADGILGISIEYPADVYDLQGNKVRSKITTQKDLSKGVYIINGKKVLVK